MPNMPKTIRLALLINDKSARDLAKFIGESQQALNMAMHRDRLGAERIELAAEFFGMSVGELIELGKTMEGKRCYK